MGELYSQNDEERFIVQHFEGRVGRFLDIGAYNPKIFSNTRRLVELGWSGVYVEPSSFAFVKFLEEYKDNDNIKLVNCAVARESKLVEFFESGGDANGTLCEGQKKKWEPKTSFKSVLIKTVNLTELLDVCGRNFDFINIDTEGTSVELFEQLLLEPLSMLGRLPANMASMRNINQQKI